MKREPADSIALTLKILTGVIAVPATLISVVFAFFVVDEFDLYTEDTSACVVVAKTNLVAGSVLTTNNLARKSFDIWELETENYVRACNAKVLLGHALVKDVGKGEPMDWYATDVVLTSGDNSPQAGEALSPPPAAPEDI